MNDETPDLLMPGEVAELLRVNAKTVTRWAQTGKIRAIRTPGGHRRFFASDVKALIGAPQTGSEA